MGESKLSWLILAFALLAVAWGAWLKFGGPKEPEKLPEWVRLPTGQLVQKETREPYEGVREVPFEISQNMIEWEFNYVGGFRNGLAREFYPDPLAKPLKSTATYVDGLRQGPVVSYHRNGVISSRVNATDDLLDGIVTHYSKHGLVTERTVVEKGFKLRVPAIAENPVLTPDESVYETEEALENDTVTTPPMIDKDGKPFTGTQVGTFWRSELMAFERGFKDGYPHGVDRFWDEEGNPEQEGAYIDGKKHGPWNQWNAGGKLIIEESFQHGLQVGPSKRWYPDGKLRVESNFVHGAQNGVRRIFRNRGGLLRETTFDHGEATHLIEWNRDNSVRKELSTPLPDGSGASIAASDSELTEAIVLENLTGDEPLQMLLGFRYRVASEKPDPGPEAARPFRASLLKDGEAQGLYDFEGELGGWRFYSWLVTIDAGETWSFEILAQPGESVIEIAGVGEVTEEEEANLPSGELDPKPENEGS